MGRISTPNKNCKNCMFFKRGCTCERHPPQVLDLGTEVITVRAMHTAKYSCEYYAQQLKIIQGGKK